MKKDHVRLRLYFTFDGTGYHGWQFQNNRDRTFQQVLEEAMKKIAKQKIEISYRICWPSKIIYLQPCFKS